MCHRQTGHDPFSGLGGMAAGGGTSRSVRIGHNPIGTLLIHVAAHIISPMHKCITTVNLSRPSGSAVVVFHTMTRRLLPVADARKQGSRNSLLPPHSPSNRFPSEQIAHRRVYGDARSLHLTNDVSSQVPGSVVCIQRKCPDEVLSVWTQYDLFKDARRATRIADP